MKCLENLALIAFTILAQMSVGAFVVLGVVNFFVARKAGVEEADRMGDRSLIAIIVVLGLGLLASLLHLGSPLSAPRAVTNIATSWLSREVLSGVIFAVLGGLYRSPAVVQDWTTGSANCCMPGWLLWSVLCWYTAWPEFICCQHSQPGTARNTDRLLHNHIVAGSAGNGRSLRSELCLYPEEKPRLC